MSKFNYDISEHILKAVAKSISDGIGVDFIHSKKQLDTFTNNSTPSMIWDLINTNCNKNLGNNFVCQLIKRKRGMWEFLLIYDKNSKKLISVMRESRLKQILKHPQKYKKHYVAALAQFLNEGLKSSQKKLFNLPKTEDEKKYLSELSKELCEDINSISISDSLYAILSFGSLNGQMSSYSSTFLTQNLELCKEESLQRYIPKDYDMVVNTETPNEIEDIPLTLKPAALKKKQAKKEKVLDIVEVKTLQVCDKIEQNEE